MMIDISDFFSWFLDSIVELFSSCLEFLGSFSIFGTPLLVFIITFFILGTVIPLVISITQKVGYRRYHNDMRRDYYNSKNKKNGD